MTRQPGQGDPGIWLLVLWFGLLAGLGEAALLAIAKLQFHRYLHLEPMVAWMAPVGEALVFAVPALILLLLSRRWRTLGRLEVRAGVLAFLAFLGPLLIAQQLHRLAAMALALGFALTSARVVARWPAGFARLVYRTSGLLVGLVLLLAAAVHGGRALRERRALAALPAAAADAPNVLLIILDTVRAMSLSLYGYERPTAPALTRWARRGVKFEVALSAAPWTLPSHASMFTGRWPHELSTGWTRTLDRTYPTLAEVMASHGYRTGGFSANIFFATEESGLGRGFARFEDWPVSAGTLFRFASIPRTLDKNRWLRRTLGFYQVLGRKSAEDINRDFLRWLPRGEGRPFFAFLNYLDAHSPYLPPAPFDGRFGGTRDRNNVLLDERYRMTPADFDQERNAYDESLAYLDHQIGALLDELDRRGDLRNTVVIITSDHGEEFGEHGLLEHGYSLYRASVQVPLLVIAPKRAPEGTVVQTPVSLRNLAATITDLAGIPEPIPLPGRSLAALWRDPAAAASFATDTLIQELGFSRGRPAWFPSSRGVMRALVAAGMRYIKTANVAEELFDFGADVDERHDLAAEPAGAARLPWFRGALEAVLARDSAAATGMKRAEDGP